MPKNLNIRKKKKMLPFLKTNADKKTLVTIVWYTPGFILWNTSSDRNPIWDSMLEFYQIWPPFQWITSLLTLVLMYWVSGYYYNKFLSKKGGGWMDWKTRMLMIFFDLIFNFSLGIYYMNYRETFLGTLMLRCPVFCSPVFWLLELICFYIYYKYFLGVKKKNS